MNVDKALAICAIVAGAVLLRLSVRFLIPAIRTRFVRDLHSHLGDSFKPAAEQRIKTLSLLIRRILSTMIWLAAVALIAQQLGLSFTAILSSLGLGGVALGFGLRTHIQDCLSGILLLWDGKIVKGDVVEFAGCRGQVQEITLRLVTLQLHHLSKEIFPDHGWTELIVPTGEFRQYKVFRKRHMSETVTQCGGKKSDD